jgi:ribosomal protein S18 acetylase RimI-like enzyme
LANLLATIASARFAGGVTSSESLIEREEDLFADGSLVGRYHLYSATPPCAEHFEVIGEAARAAGAIISEMRGWNLTTTDVVLADELMALGATSTRRYAVMNLDLAASELPGAEVIAAESGSTTVSLQQLTPDTPISGDLIDLVRRAYPPGHPDQELGSDDEIRADMGRALNGERLGALMSVSRIAVDAGRPVGLAIVNRVPGRAPTGGPWLTDLCRDPDPSYAGLGRRLLVAILRESQYAGEASMSLAVTDGNNARHLYEALGFAVVASTHKLRLPE